MLEKINYADLVERNIRELMTEFRGNPYNFFSESDVKCRLFKILYRDDYLSRLKNTIDGKMISPLSLLPMPIK